MNGPVAIVGTGMVTGVGLSAPASCAAIRCALDNFQETRFMDKGGEWIIGSAVPFESPSRGVVKLSEMLLGAVTDVALSVPDLELSAIPILVCISEAGRPGRPENLAERLFASIQHEFGTRPHPDSKSIPHGRVSCAIALNEARALIYRKNVERVLIIGVDSFLSAPTLAAYEEQGQLLTSENSNGFLPGEAAAALIVESPSRSAEAQLICNGIGFGAENAAYGSGLPLRGDGLVQAIRAALQEARCDFSHLDYRVIDASGKQFTFKEASLAVTRMLRERKESLDVLHPADCIGEVGAAIGHINLGLVLAASEKSYSPGSRVLCHLGNDDGARAAMILTYTGNA